MSKIRIIVDYTDNYAACPADDRIACVSTGRTFRAMLHYTEGLVPKSALAKATGINQQQLTHYASGYRIPRPGMRQRILDGIHSIAAKLIAIS